MPASKQRADSNKCMTEIAPSIVAPGRFLSICTPPGNPAIKGNDSRRPVALRPHLSMGLPFSVRHTELAIATSLRVPHLNKAIGVPNGRENVNCVKLLFFHAT